MKQSFAELPHGYTAGPTIDLQRNVKLAILINVVALVIAIAMLVPAVLLVSPFETFPIDNLGDGLLRMLVLLVGMVVYMVLHELVHGIFMKHYSGLKPHYGFTGLYAYAGSTGYFCRSHYITIALAPVVVWGIVLVVLNFLVPAHWFYVVFILQVINISGAAGDFYVTAKFLKLPQDILIFDSGVAMQVYLHESASAQNISDQSIPA